MVGPIAGPKVLIMPNMTKGNERFGSGKVGTRPSWKSESYRPHKALNATEHQ